jgi:hypothetical protein
MLKVVTFYVPKKKLWAAYLEDHRGNAIGDPEYGVTKEVAAFQLGAEYGSNPKAFSLPLSELLTNEE